MENATTTVSMVIELMNAKRNQSLRASVTNARNKVTRHPNADLSYSIQQNKLWRQYSIGTTTLGVDVIIVENMDTLAWIVLNITWEDRIPIRCDTCTELGHIAKNCINIGKFEDEKKRKVDNIRK